MKRREEIVGLQNFITPTKLSTPVQLSSVINTSALKQMNICQNVETRYMRTGVNDKTHCSN